MRLISQLLLMVAIIGVLLWYVGINTLVTVLSKTNPEYLLLAFLAYFIINILFTIRIVRVLQRQGIKATFGRTILAQYGGMLASDVTPGRSGYVLTAVFLKNQGIDTTASLTSIFGIQSIEFLVKVLGGALALMFLLNQTNLTGELFWIASIGIGLMLLGGFALAALIWFPKSAGLIRRIAGFKPISRFTAGIIGKLETFAENAFKTRSAIPEMAFITFLSWIMKGFEWYYLGLAVGVTRISWLGFFLLHPLTTAFGFVPFTPSGIGFQEGAIVGIFLLLGVDIRVALAFAILSRSLLVIEDLLGVAQIAKSTQTELLATTRLHRE